MGPSRFLAFVVPVVASINLGACAQYHDARVQTAALLPPPTAAPVVHSTKLWIELGNATWENQCRSPKGQRPLCFDGVRRAAFGALARGLWTSFPEVALRDGDPVQAGDYVLRLDITLNALPPDAEGPGWSALAAGGFQLSRDGRVLHEERLGSRSRATFPYGSALGVGAGEVVDAFASHVAGVLGAVAEDHPMRATPLPAVVAEVLTPAGAADPTPAPAPVPASEPTQAPAAPAEPAAPIGLPAPVAASALGAL
jgi:hypothetical protein